MAVEIEIIKIDKSGPDLDIRTLISDDMGIGTYDTSWRLDSGKITNDMVIYDTKRPGRGISLLLDPDNKDSVKMKLPIPCADHDVEVFIDAALRIGKKMNGFIKTSDGIEMPLQVFVENEDSIREFNRKTIIDVCDKILGGETDSFMLFGAFWPLSMGKTEAELFKADPLKFDEWMRQKQTTDYYYAGANFYRGKDGIFGLYVLGPDYDSVFPKKPTVPFGFAVGGDPLKCDDFRVAIANSAHEKIGELKYEEFISRLPADKVSRYDEACIVINGLSDDELKKLL